MLWNQFTKDVHQNAVEHGWWDEERSFGEIVSLCHSELSEALEEFRAKRPMVWFACIEGDQEHPCNPQDEYDCRNCGKEVDCEYRSQKPEGIAVELADCIIRILDWFGVRGLDTYAYLSAGKRYSKREMPDSIGDVIAELHYDLSLAFGTNGRRDVYLAVCVNEIMLWAQQNDIDMEAILKVKHEYNKGRPYRHGGKAL